MGVYVKDMRMPTNCAACRIGHRDTGWDNKDNEHEIVFCPIIQQGSLIADANVKRHQLCPLVPVPVPPHGRLIDADALIKSLSLDEDDAENGASLLMAIFIEVLKAAPTIIPAEEEKS